MSDNRRNLSVIVITRNEGRNIGECLKSVEWADQIVVVDSGSTDRTVELARQFTPHVFQHSWLGYGEAKNFALDHCTCDWVLWLDADERVTPELAEEICSIITRRGKQAGYEVARRAYFIGKWIRHCGWYPGYVTRLFRRTGAHFSTARVHEGLLINGSIGRLQHDLLHFTDKNLFHYFKKFNRYTSLAAEDLAESERPFSLWDLLVRPAFLFFKMYFLRRGFLDGMHGFVLSLLSAAYVFVKYAKTWELTVHRRRRSL